MVSMLSVSSVVSVFNLDILFLFLTKIFPDSIFNLDILFLA